MLRYLDEGLVLVKINDSGQASRWSDSKIEQLYNLMRRYQGANPINGSIV